MGLLTAYGITYHVLDVLTVPVTSVFVNNIRISTRVAYSVDSYKIICTFNLANNTTKKYVRGAPP